MSDEPALILLDDVVFIPASELYRSLAENIEAGDDDFVVTRPNARSLSTLIDADTERLLRSFREPRTATEAIDAFCAASAEDSEEARPAAAAVIEQFLRRGVLVVAGSEEPPPHKRGPSLPPGATVAGVTVLSSVVAQKDTETYVVRGQAHDAILKIEGLGGGGHAALEWEATALGHLAGEVAPALLEQGQVDGRRYLLLEHCGAARADTVADHWKSRWLPGDRRRLLRLSIAVADAYARLHELGVVHGDVHAGNILVGRDGSVRLVDFAHARLLSDDRSRARLPLRAGVAYHFEPEFARALLAGTAHPPVSLLGEQYAVASVLYQLFAGQLHLDFKLTRKEMLRQIISEPMRPLDEGQDRGWTPLPAVERALAAALAKEPADRFASVADLADALRAAAGAGDGDLPADPTPDVPESSADARAVRGGSHHASDGRLAAVIDDVVREFTTDGRWYREGLPPPAASVQLGAAGVALALCRIGVLHADANVQSCAREWTFRAVDAARSFDEAFLDEKGYLSTAMVGEVSPYNAPAGVSLAQAMVARWLGDEDAVLDAVRRSLAGLAGTTPGLDLWFGRAGALLSAALLADLLPSGTLPGDGSPALDEQLPEPELLSVARRLQVTGDDACDRLWADLDAKGRIADGDVAYLGMAHGWAGFLYATLRWSRATGRDLPDAFERRLGELADLAQRWGRGLRWPWALSGPEAGGFMPGWCSGSSGYVFLWTAAAQVLDSERYADLASGAGWDAYDNRGESGNLCCGLAGRSYALLNLHRSTGDPSWLQRARRLALRAAHRDAFDPDYAHSLYKGRVGLALLAAELEQPGRAAQPMFESA